MFKKVLVANRGEIAVRVMRTLREMGIRTVAVFSDPDRAALHTLMADEAYPLGGTTSAESYLRGEKIIEIARRSGAEAIHPGYGFLSENADFEDLCGKNDIVFIGPSAAAIRQMGDK
ncbi:MAG: acetyl-CoA carboxylase biotin carboxylase subunit, partial [Acidobacteria bacterium]